MSTATYTETVLSGEERGCAPTTGAIPGASVTGKFVVDGEHSRLNLVADSKGLAQARLRADGRSGHRAYPWLGGNALLKPMNTVARLVARYPVPTEEMWRTTANLARVDPPDRAFNQVPAQTEAWLDVRFPAEDADLNGRTPEQIAEYPLSFREPGVTVAVDRVEPPHHAGHERLEGEELRRAAQRQGYPAEIPVQSLEHLRSNTDE